MLVMLEGGIVFLCLLRSFDTKFCVWGLAMGIG